MIAMLDHFENTIRGLREDGKWTKEEVVTLFQKVLPTFMHEEKGKSLDSKM